VWCTSTGHRAIPATGDTITEYMTHRRHRMGAPRGIAHQDLARAGHDAGEPRQQGGHIIKAVRGKTHPGDPAVGEGTWRSHTGTGVDIGLSGLIKWIRYPVVNSETAGLDVVTSVADQFDGAFAYQLLQDCLVLLDSLLSSQDIETLWLAGTFREFDLERLGLDGRVWLRRIADICTDRIRCDYPSFIPAVAMPVVDEAVKEAVAAEVRSVGPALEQATAHHAYSPLDGVVPALQRAVDVDPDLGFRLLLRVLKGYFVPISQARYERYLAFGDELGLGADVVDDREFNIPSDLVD
jgi:hypothetical protein